LILLDTQVVIWLAGEPERLSSKAITAIEEARRSGGGLAVCDITLWELTLLSEKGRVSLEGGLDRFLQQVELGFKVLPINARACSLTLSLPPSYPRDPADRLIGATALASGLSLVTSDRGIRRSRAVPVIW
jgi:PIN domain nuclease of toxin-antitoxin system